MQVPDQIVAGNTVWCLDGQRARKSFAGQRVPYVNVDIDQDPEAMASVKKSKWRHISMPIAPHVHPAMVTE